MRKYISLIPGLAAGVAGILVIAWFSLQPNPPEKLLAIFPPQATATDLFDILSHTDSNLVGPAGLSFAFILQSNNPDIIKELRQAGAIAVLNAEDIGGCSGQNKGKLNEPV